MLHALFSFAHTHGVMMGLDDTSSHANLSQHICELWPCQGEMSLSVGMELSSAWVSLSECCYLNCLPFELRASIFNQYDKWWDVKGLKLRIYWTLPLSFPFSSNPTGGGRWPPTLSFLFSLMLPSVRSWGDLLGLSEFIESCISLKCR